MHRPALSFRLPAVRLAALALLVCALARPQAPAVARQPSLGGCSPAITIASPADSGPGSLRQSVLDICAGGTIDFAADLTIPLQTRIRIPQPLTIDGSGQTVVISGTLAASTAGSGGIFDNISTSGPVTLRHLTLTGGGASQGGAIYNRFHLALDDLTITASATGSTGHGGAIYNTGALTMTDSLLSGNSAGRGGAISNNTAGRLTISATSFVSNTAGTLGGAIHLNGGLLTISATSFVSNTAAIGGAIVASSGESTISNSTFAANRARIMSGAIEVAGGSVVTSISNSTFSGNRSPSSGSLNNVGLLALRNTIIANTSPGADCANIGTLTANQNNLVEDGTCAPALAGDPLLAPLGGYDGPTPTFALLPGSPAHGAADAASCAASPVNGIDQRGRPRPADCDIGAFESQGFALSVAGGDNQATRTGAAFPAPLAATLSAKDPIEPRGPGGLVTFSGPASGAGITPTLAIVATDEQGAASLQATANAIAGSYAVTATAGGASQPAAFALRQFDCAAAIQVTSDADSGAGSLRQAVAGACPGATITFAGDYTIRLAERIVLDTALTIDGAGRAVTISGDTDSDGSPNTQLFAIPATGAVTMTHLRLERGVSSDGGVVHITGGRLTLRDSVLAENRAGASGGALMQEGGALLIADTAFISNTAGINGGALHLEDTAAMIANSAFAGSSATNGGAIQTLGGNLTMVNATISGSSSGNAALRRLGGTFALRNTIIANSAAGADCSGITASASSLIEDGTCAPAFSGDPLLSALGDYGGATPAFALLPGSPAIDNGNSAACAASPVGGLDQRGVARPAACDIGAFESQGFILVNAGGDQQTAAVNSAFAEPLLVMVIADAEQEPVGPGGVISFSAPMSGASLAQPTASAPTAADGSVRLAVAANGNGGRYAVAGSTRGEVSGALFMLTNVHKVFAPLIMR